MSPQQAKIIKPMLGLLELAKQFGNVSQTCQIMGSCLLFRKKLYRSLEELQVDLDAWLESYNREPPHSGRYCYGKTPWETFQASKHLALAKDLSRGGDQSDNTIQQPAAVS